MSWFAAVLALARLAIAAPAADPDSAVDRAAACIIARDAPLATRLARALPGTPREDALIAEAMPILSSCLGPTEASAQAPRFTEVLGRVAELIYMQHGKVISVLRIPIKDQDRLHFAQQSLLMSQDWPTPSGSIVCAVNRDPSKAEILIHSKHGSADEERALTAFTTLLSPCVPAGEPFHATAVQLRSIVARARLSHNFEDDRNPAAQIRAFERINMIEFKM